MDTGVSTQAQDKEKVRAGEEAASEAQSQHLLFKFKVSWWQGKSVLLPNLMVWEVEAWLSEGIN